MLILSNCMKRTELYTQKETGACYGDFGKNLFKIQHQRKYLYVSPECSVLVSLTMDSNSRVKDADEATLDIMPPTAELPKEISDLLERNHFVRKYR